MLPVSAILENAFALVTYSHFIDVLGVAINIHLPTYLYISSTYCIAGKFQEVQFLRLGRLYIPIAGANAG